MVTSYWTIQVYSTVVKMYTLLGCKRMIYCGVTVSKHKKYLTCRKIVISLYAEA